MLKLIPATSFREGRWLNGMGVSWDIAAEPPESGMTDFGWRFAIARIDGDVPFSRYPDVDRIFTLIEGNGLTLRVGDHTELAVHERHVPWRFDGAADTYCTVRDGPCRALNLFLRRGLWRGEATVARGRLELSTGPCDVAVVFALRGDCRVADQRLAQGDAALAGAGIAVSANGDDALLYVARLVRL